MPRSTLPGSQLSSLPPTANADPPDGSPATVPRDAIDCFPLWLSRSALLSCTALHCTVRCCIALALAPYPTLALTQLPFSYKVVFQIAGSDGARPVRRSSCRICIHSFLSTPPTNPLAQVASAGPRRQRICKGSRKRKSRPVRVSWHVCHFRCCVFHFRIRSQTPQKP
jgi:hypothetical protein